MTTQDNQTMPPQSPFKIDTENNMAPSVGLDYYGSPAQKNFNWIAAIIAWDYCDPTPLSEMIKNHPIPEELRPLIADIISFKRKPNAKGADKLKIPADLIMPVAATVYCQLSLCDAVLNKKTSPTYLDVGDREGLEPHEARKKYQGIKNRAYENISKTLPISKTTLKNLIRDYKKTLENYPNI